MTADAHSHQLLDARTLARLQWRCRRGLLENDLFITRFFERHGATLTFAQGQAMETLMDLSDNDLLDLLLERKEPEPDWAGNEVIALVHLMRADGAHREQPALASTVPTSPQPSERKSQ